jgi:hypothetical protein
MARLARVTQPIFAGSASNNGVFGSAQANAGPGTDSNVLATIMGLAAWSAGWLSAVIGGSKFPPLEEFQAIDYVITSQLAYLFQQGIAEYDTGTTYYTNSIVVNGGTYDVYGSNTNGNIGNALSNATYWTKFGNLSSLGNAPNQFNGGVSTGSANAQVVASTTPATGLSLSNNGNVLIFTAGFTNTSATTVAVTSPAISATAVKKVSGGSLVALTGGEISSGNSIILIVNTTAGCWVLSNTLPIGTLAGLGISGNSGINDGASNYAPAIWNQASTTGASKTYALSDAGNLIQRSNSASAMTDTVPGTSGALANGLFFYIENIDASATDTVSAGSGGSFTFGNTTGLSAFIVHPGERCLVTAKGSGVYSITRVSFNVLSGPPALLSYTKLIAQSAVGATTMTAKFDEATVAVALGKTRHQIISQNLTLNLASSGAGGMDTGTSPTASVALHVYLIYNPTTQISALLGTNSGIGQTIYPGSLMPSGYTESCILGSYCLNASSQFTGFYQTNGVVSLTNGVNGFMLGSGLTGTGSITNAAISPPNAIRISGNANGSIDFGGDANFTGVCAPSNIQAPYSNVPMITPSTVFYEAFTSATIFVSGYELW